MRRALEHAGSAATEFRMHCLKFEVLIEEELGQNPESGEGWTEYNFQAPSIPLFVARSGWLENCFACERQHDFPKRLMHLALLSLPLPQGTKCKIS